MPNIHVLDQNTINKIAETVEFCALFTAPPIVRPATQTRTRCVLKQGSPV